MTNNTAPRLFAELLAPARDRAGWTRREIADAAGITPQFVAYLERLRSEIPIERFSIESQAPEQQGRQALRERPNRDLQRYENTATSPRILK